MELSKSLKSYLNFQRSFYLSDLFTVLKKIILQVYFI